MTTFSLAGASYTLTKSNLGQIKALWQICEEPPTLSTSASLDRAQRVVAVGLRKDYPGVVIDDNCEATVDELTAAMQAVLAHNGFAMVAPTGEAPAAPAA